MKGINNKILLIVFVILAIAAVIMYFYDRNKGDRTFKSELFKVDSAQVTAITIYPKGKGDSSLSLVKTGKNWEIKSGKRSWPADTSVVQNIISTLLHAKPERVASKDRSSWKEMEITDSLSTRIVVYENNDDVADFRLGKISFSQGDNMPGYGRRQNIIAKSHVRVADDDRVYVVDGFLNMMFSGQVSMYRNRMVFRLDKNQLTKLSFIYPGDSSFTLERAIDRWLLNGEPADSTKVDSYLNSIRNTVSTDFADETTQPPVYPYTLTIEGNNMATIVVKGAIDVVSKKYFMTSTFNPASVFGSTNPGLFQRVFAGIGKFRITRNK
jgi:hypothetical protein